MSFRGDDLVLFEGFLVLETSRVSVFVYLEPVLFDSIFGFVALRSLFLQCGHQIGHVFVLGVALATEL